MNFLAHLLIADADGPSRVGSILPDLARHRDLSDLDPRVIAAAAQHRRVDAFTDTHPVTARSKSRILATHGRFSGILVDVFYDHILAASFERYHDQSLSDFVASVYADFQTHESLMPMRMRLPISRMIEQDWLGSYATVEGIAARLTQMSDRLSRRFNREVRLAEAAADLTAQHDDFANDFHEFFPQLKNHILCGSIRNSS